ncbi:TPA: hypothetical protein HA251_02040 [Candidatus Woesearchaeota archaeon]|nr:hypothetical protein [Candidatus Woesearchaeota archaeon]
MTEPLNITIDRLSEQYDNAKREIESLLFDDNPITHELMGEYERARGALSRIGLNMHAMFPGVDADISQNEIVIERRPDVFRLYGVQYRGRSRTVDLTKKLLNNGESMHQHEWMQKYPLGIIGQIGVPDIEIIFNMIAMLNKNKDHPHAQQRRVIEEVRQQFRDDFKGMMMTSTCDVKHAIVHQYSTPQAVQSKEVTYRGSLSFMWKGDADAVTTALANMPASTFIETVQQLQLIKENNQSIKGDNVSVGRESGDNLPYTLGVHKWDILCIHASNFDAKQPARGVAIREKHE